MSKYSTINKDGIEHILQLKKSVIPESNIPKELLYSGNLQLLKNKTIGLTDIEQYPGHNVINHFLEVIEFCIDDSYTIVIAIDETFIIFLNHLLVLKSKYNFNLIICVNSFEPRVLEFIYKYVKLISDDLLMIFFCDSNFENELFLLEYICDEMILFSIKHYQYYLKVNLSIKQMFILESFLWDYKLHNNDIIDKNILKSELIRTYKDLPDLKDKIEFGRRLITVK